MMPVILATIPTTTEMLASMSQVSQPWFDAFLPWILFGLAILAGSLALIFLYTAFTTGLDNLIDKIRGKNKFE